MLNKTCFVVTIAMAVGTVGCGGGPSDEGEATTENAALTTPMALRFWDAGLCLQSHDRGNDVTPEKCSFSAPRSQQWAYENTTASGIGGFTIHGYGGCLVPLGTSNFQAPTIQSCSTGDSQDISRTWQIPDAPLAGTLPTQANLFELRHAKTSTCLTVYSTGGGRFALRMNWCEANRMNRDQTMMTDTFVQ